MHPVQDFVGFLLPSHVNKSPAWMPGAVWSPCITVILLQVISKSHSPIMSSCETITSPSRIPRWSNLVRFPVQLWLQAERSGAKHTALEGLRLSDSSPDPRCWRSSHERCFDSDHGEAEKQLGCSDLPTALLTCRMWSHVEWHLHWHGQVYVGSEIRRIQNTVQKHLILTFLFCCKERMRLWKR